MFVVSMNVSMPSTVDWCEGNYQITEYIAEFWNTVSGMCLVFSGILFYENNTSWIQKRSKYTANFCRLVALMVLVGVGTILFHSTLYYPFQLLDELPMILLANEYINVLLMLTTTQCCLSMKYYTVLRKVVGTTRSLIPFIVVVYFVDPVLQIFLFHIALKMSEISVIFVLYKLSTKLNHIVYSQICKDQDFLQSQNKKMTASTIGFNVYRRSVKTQADVFKRSSLLYISQKRIKTYLQYRNRLNRITRVGLCVYGASLGLWCLENLFCKYVEPLQFHALWHVLSSIGVYHLNSIIKTHVEIDQFTFGQQD